MASFSHKVQAAITCVYARLHTRTHNHTHTNEHNQPCTRGSRWSFQPKCPRQGSAARRSSAQLVVAWRRSPLLGAATNTCTSGSQWPRPATRAKQLSRACTRACTHAHGVGQKQEQTARWDTEVQMDRNETAKLYNQISLEWQKKWTEAVEIDRCIRDTQRQER